MPRGVTVNLTSNSETSEKDLTKNVVVKSECNNGSEEQVIHRKSARRRTARDIFLVFEEQRQGRGCNRKRSQIKSKFAHLRVQDPNANSRARACLLRDIKNEPKCYLDPSPAVNVKAAAEKLPQNAVSIETQAHQNQSETKATKLLPRKQKRVVSTKKLKSPRCAVRKSASSIANATATSTSTSAATSTASTATAPTSSSSSSTTAPSTINPIFLWAKQDDTRIVEVRCEDYDKRNRIRITKTTTGWRAIPRSDASTSRIVKYFQTPSSLMKLKREIYDSKLLAQQNESFFEQPLEYYSNITSTECNGFIEVCENQSETTNQIHIGVNTFDESVDKVHTQLELENNNDHEKFNNCNYDDISTASAQTSVSIINQEECTTFMNSPDRLSENESHNFQSYFNREETKEIETVTTNSDTYQTYTSELRLCPKTGLFFSSSSSKEVESNEEEANDSGIHTDIDAMQCQIDSENAPSVSVDSVIGSLNTDATNLKDLLDDADLLQHCNDSDVNCDSELIDSLVKHGCESTLISQTDILKSATSFHKATTIITSPKDSIDEGIVDNMLPQMLDAVSEPHKCLSFNEDGEIEVENGEQLFQTLQNFSNAFDREHQRQTPTPQQQQEQLPTIENTNNTLNPKAIETISMPLRNATSINEGALSLNAAESSPKDLSHRKNNETMCRPTSESQSQCAVTSSSDVLLSPLQHQNEVPNVESGTENIKNFILEQFINLNALKSLPKITTKQKQSEPIDLGQQKEQKQKKPDVTPSTEFIETVIIDDNSSDEPAKKKVCNKMDKKIVPHLTSLLPPTAATKTTITNNIDGDPDPLTQLQLLLRNTQWKVPDPILVPKDRLAAVLASPAREIPLLITTRPELRLPEAFAYPHIIQNPNILVISMAQLEAILKNEMEISKNNLDLLRNATKITTPKATSKTGADVDDEDCALKALHGMAAKSQSKDLNLNTKCSYVESSSNSMATDKNAATLAVINQMLWLPYLGQWSQDFLSTLKTPVGLSNQFGNLLEPSYDHHTAFGLQHLDEVYKAYLKEMPNPNTKIQQSDSDSTLAGFQTSPLYLRAISALQNQVDIMLLQKLAQQQLPNFASSEQPSSSSSSSLSSSSSSTPLSKKDEVPLEPLPLPFPFTETASNLLLRQQQQQQLRAVNNRQKYSKDLLKPNSGNSCTVDYENIGNVADMLNKGSHQQKSIVISDKVKTKPRLTCKSLSNLLEPENRSLRTLPLINLTPEAQETGTTSFSETCIESTASNFPNTPLKQSIEYVSTEFEKRRSFNLQQPQFTTEKTLPNLKHLKGRSHFDSGMNGVHNSQWNWTTVTATGE